ncbi:exportin-5-like [Mercenaria mercenaria]|uniref:exportin-5-like n=1 Tax=Mercenaria mercenaria TaxID=6596 RepID=UPI00234E87AC|nr:exportin-5-like [Mercenaria mercenaria]
MNQDDVNTLVSSVQVIMSPNATPADRQTAHQICEEFKENSPYCIPCGLTLSERVHPHIIRHFGLQLLQHVIRYRWTKLTVEEKDLLKASSLTLIEKGTSGILEEQPHIKDAVSRIVVEILKHDWPNLWPSLMPDLYRLCLQGPTQTELVLKVFLRLVEDIIIFQNMQHQRRRELVNALNVNAGELIELFLNLLEEHTKKGDTLMNSGSEESRKIAQCHLKVSEETLMTLNGYVDWVPMSHVIIKDSLLLQMLCLLLSHTTLQLPAAECLYTIVSRRGKIEDRKPLLILFHEGAMSTIWEAAITAEKGSKDEHFYKVLQKCCQILVELGRQLCALWGAEASPEVSQPPNFQKYLEALLACTKHPSQMLSSYTLTLWAQFIRHEKISKDPMFQAILPQLIESASKTLLKVGFPSQCNSPSCDYARLDFDNDEEFSIFFSKYRAEVAEIVRQATLLIPTTTFGYASQWVRLLLSKPVDNGEDSKTPNCNLSSPSFLEWDGLTVFLESVMCRMKLDNQPQSCIDDGISLLKAVLNYESQDPLILSGLLSCISALFIFLKYTPDTLMTVLRKIFSAVVFNLPGQTKSTRSKAVKNVRQHACSILVKICKQYQDLVFPVFDELFNHIQSISNDPDQLSQMERCILMEAMILISNKFNNFEKQSSFIEEVTKPVKEFWSSEEFKIAFWSTDKLMSYVGLDQAPVEPSSADTCGINRSHISYCIHTILAVIKRSKWPDDVQIAKDGGFVIGTAKNGDSIMRNPATVHITCLLENVLALLKAMNMLFCEEFMRLRHPDYSKAYDLPDNEIHSLLGIPQPHVDNTSLTMSRQPIERMQNFLTISYEICFHILGNAGQCLGSEFYAIPNLAQSMIQTVLSNLDVVPDYRLRPIIRVFLKPYIQHCPSEYYTAAVIPVLAHVCPFMYLRLGKKWQDINERCQTRRDTDDDNQESQEVVEEQVTRQLTREYVELLGTVFFKKSSAAVEEKMLEEEETPTQPQARELGELGKLCLLTESVCEPLVITAFGGLCWMDTPTCVKCMALANPILKQLIADNKMSGSAAYHFYGNIVMSLQHQGQFEGVQSLLLGLGLQTYELLRPLFPEVRKLMLEIPKCTEEALNVFDEKILGATPTQKMGEKKKKDAYKKLVAEAIGKYVGQQFKREIHYQSLPNLFRRIRHRQPTLDDIEHKDIGLCSLFKPEANGDS